MVVRMLIFGFAPMACKPTTTLVSGQSSPPRAQQGELPDKLSVSEIKAPLSALSADVSRCARKSGLRRGEKLAVKLVVSGATGRISKSVVVGRDPEHPAHQSDCLGSVLKRAQFSQFRSDTMMFVYKFKI